MTAHDDSLPALTDDCDAIVVDEDGPFAPGDAIDELEIVEEIGRGGMCIVYKAREPSLGRQVALKVLRPSVARQGEVAERFHRESMLAANLCHPNIAAVYAKKPGRGQTPPYFTMELIDGESIEQRVVRAGPLPVDLAVRTGIQAARALAFAHGRGVIHRDVTPRNVLLQREPSCVRLVDFGIAKDVGGRLAETFHTTESSAGTVAFMSPEQNLNRPLDGRTDVFSLGATLYYALTARVAYEAANRAELALAFRLHKPAPPSRYNRTVPPGLDRVLLRMIDADPDGRQADLEQVASDLLGVLSPDRVRPAWPGRRSYWHYAAGLVGLAVVGLGAATFIPQGTDGPGAPLGERGARPAPATVAGEPSASLPGGDDGERAALPVEPRRLSAEDVRALRGSIREYAPPPGPVEDLADERDSNRFDALRDIRRIEDRFRKALRRVW
jgi:serine/threonine-protein kinase